MLINMDKYYSPNFNFQKRTKSKIKFIIIHYTGMKNEKEAIARLINIQSKVSCHYFIKKNGELINMVPDFYIAWHAGKSKWKKHISLNSSSIGIEISNPGHDFNYKKFNKKQINSLVNLIKNLKEKYKINLKNILGHSDISPDRKKDPGEKFPWEFLSKKNISIWHKIKKNDLKILRKLKVNEKEKKIFLKI